MGKQKTIPNNVLKWQQIMVTQMHGYDPGPANTRTEYWEAQLKTVTSLHPHYAT
jgi:hypothetical protein